MFQKESIRFRLDSIYFFFLFFFVENSHFSPLLDGTTRNEIIAVFTKTNPTIPLQFQEKESSVDISVHREYNNDYSEANFNCTQFLTS